MTSSGHKLWACITAFDSSYKINGLKYWDPFPSLCSASSTQVGWLESREFCLHVRSSMGTAMLIHKYSHLISVQPLGDLNMCVQLFDCFLRPPIIGESNATSVLHCLSSGKLWDVLVGIPGTYAAGMSLDIGWPARRAWENEHGSHCSAVSSMALL